MNKSESIANIAQALSLFQGEVANPKNTANNPFFKSKYCPLNEVINTTRPILAKHGLSVLQSPSGDGEHIVVTTLLMHSSGEWIEGEPLVLKADKVTAQGAGSAISYGRRYALSAILGISSDEDDDGNHANGNKDKPDTKPRQNTAIPQTNTAQPKHDKPYQPVNFANFWGSCRTLGFSKEEVHVIAKAESLKDWDREKLNNLHNILKGLSPKKEVNGNE